MNPPLNFPSNLSVYSLMAHDWQRSPLQETQSSSSLPILKYKFIRSSTKPLPQLDSHTQTRRVTSTNSQSHLTVKPLRRHRLPPSSSSNRSILTFLQRCSRNQILPSHPSNFSLLTSCQLPLQIEIGYSYLFVVRANGFYIHGVTVPITCLFKSASRLINVSEHSSPTTILRRFGCGVQIGLHGSNPRNRKREMQSPTAKQKKRGRKLHIG